MYCRYGREGFFYDCRGGVIGPLPLRRRQIVGDGPPVGYQIRKAVALPISLSTQNQPPRFLMILKETDTDLAIALLVLSPHPIRLVTPSLRICGALRRHRRSAEEQACPWPLLMHASRREVSPTHLNRGRGCQQGRIVGKRCARTPVRE